jgi:hypothetical protein
MMNLRVSLPASRCPERLQDWLAISKEKYFHATGSQRFFSLSLPPAFQTEIKNKQKIQQKNEISTGTIMQPERAEIKGRSN